MTRQASEFPLGAMLRIFEKILTGIPDGHQPCRTILTRVTTMTAITSTGPITAQIAQLHRLFDPWTTPEEFLPWLASMGGARLPDALQGTFPAVGMMNIKRRTVTSNVTQIYRLRGRKAGLNKYLDLYCRGPHPAPRRPG